MNTTEKTMQALETLIFTDLDGSLLDHFNYRTEPADRYLLMLETLHIPVIFCTSKTFSEVVSLREQLNNRHPFIVENGAAIYLPGDYFPRDIPGFRPSHHPGYLYLPFCQERSHWLQKLRDLSAEFSGQFISFDAMGTTRIMRETGLNEAQARLANERQFSEPVKWLGDEAQKKCFIDRMIEFGANIEAGGRFLHLIGHCDKARALRHLRQIYQTQQTSPIHSIAIGDGPNDVRMLEAADQAILIRSPVHPFPSVEHEHLMKSQHYGPHGWVETINKVFNL
jgi:mannosyl-3-phosphoglycerate phosphatase family protein